MGPSGMKRKRHPIRIGEHLDSADAKRKLNKRLFTRIAREYRWMPAALSLGRDGFWKKRLVDVLPDWSTPSCVDIACGDGDLTRRLARRYPGGSILGIDLTPAMLCRARQFTTESNVRYAQADMASIGVASDSVDVVTGGYALRNAPDLDQVIAEVARILRPGGYAGFLEFMRWPGPVSGRVEIASLWIWGAVWGVLLHRNADVYAYIAESLRRFPTPNQLIERLDTQSLRLVCRIPCLFGVTAVLLFRKMPRGLEDRT